MKRAATSVVIGSFLLNIVEISLFLKSINREVGTKNFFVTEMLLHQAQQKHLFWKSVDNFFFKEPPQVSDRVAFLGMSENITAFKVYKWGSRNYKFFFVTEVILFQSHQKHIFWKSVHTCVCKEPLQVSDSVAFIEMSENITDFEVHKLGSQK